MTSKKLLPLTLFLLFIQNIMFGQASTPVADSINSNLTTLINSSNSFKAYKVIKFSKIQDLKRSIYTQVSAIEQDLTTLHKKLSRQKSQLQKVKEEATKNKAALNSVIQEKNQLALLGINTSKSTFYIIISVLFIALILALVTFIYKFKQSHRITIEARHQLNKKEEEFDVYRKKALEEQQKLGRQIINERNKHKQPQAV